MDEPIDTGKVTGRVGNGKKMPVLFVGHGSPMNAITENEFTRGWRDVADQLPRPTAILCISAHWETPGTQVTAMEWPRTIHDFGGFPRELYEVNYPAPGSPDLATRTQELFHQTAIGLDTRWGLDHGTWSVIRNMYPDASIPVVQLSLDYLRKTPDHYELAHELAPLRDQGVLIIGSGNMVHNLPLVAWNSVDEPEFGFDWALEANEKIKELILKDDHDALVKYNSQGLAMQMAVPTPDHYLPLIYVLALKNPGESIRMFNDKAVMGSLTMTSVLIG